MRKENFLEEYDFDLPDFEIVEDEQEAFNAAKEIGFPVVLKIESLDVSHKTDIGGVKLNLKTEAQVKESFSEILENVKKQKPSAEITGVRVEEMCDEGIEIIIGLDYNDQFGPTIMIGLGGIFTEVFNDISFRLLPIERKDAKEMIHELQAQEMLEGFRNRPPVSEKMLVDLLMRANRMGTDLQEKLDSIDLNPVAVWKDQHRVLDFEPILEGERNSTTVEKPNTDYLEEFFKPNSVAVVGASETPGKIGNVVLDSLVNHEYGGDVYPVNPKRDEIMGIECNDSISDLPESIDLVVVSVGLSLIPDIMRECHEKDIHNMVILSGGGKELGGERENIEKKIAKLSKELDIRVVGPNCIGVFDGESRTDTFFQSHERMVRPKEGEISLLTQSGTVGISMLEEFEDIGVGRFVSYGNRVDVDEADLLAYLSEDPETDVIACYLEGLSDGRKFYSQALKVADDKPIVVYKAGRTQKGAEASMSHTGFFGGTYEVYRGAFRQSGVIDVDSMEEFYAVAKALAKQAPASGNKVAMVSNGAGTMVQAFDILNDYELEIGQLEKSTIKTLKDLDPDFFIVKNPLDVTGSATSEHYRIGIENLLKDENIDIVMPWFVFQDTPLDEGIIEVLNNLSTEYDKPILGAGKGGPYTENISKRIESVGVPIFHSVREWVAAARGLSKFSR